ncbi:MAG TPA: carbonic anhydrase [Roseiflexaceae bacterium]|nr:carbonic anhydrase [Roseiflexaceae bacterium]
MKNIGRRTFLRGVGFSGLGLAATACGAQGSTTQPTPVAEAPAASPDEALQRLVEGNQRFVSGQVRHPNLTSARLTEVSQGQKPFACVLGCADSRVSPELIFDRGLGDIFVVRSAGNIADPVAIGSLEYGVAVLGTKVLLVLGHERCGAVAETLKGEEAPGSIQALIDAIKPGIAASQGQSGDALDNAVVANVKYQMAQLFEQSTILSDAVKAGTLKIVGGRYDLDKGELTLLG